VPDTTTPERSVRWGWPITFPLALIGLADAIYLTVAHFDTKVVLACSATSHVNCEKVTQSAQSEIFGHIPVSLLGAIYFVVGVAICSPWAWKYGNLWLDRIRLAGVTVGMGMVVYLVTVEAHLHAICLYCTGIHIVTFLLFVTILAAYLLRPLDAD
jgi:uncharacterized membrane protein